MLWQFQIVRPSPFGPPSISTDDFTADWYGRVLHFGVREHAMGAILSGIVLHGPTRAYGGTFLQFADYMRGAVRLGSLTGLRTACAVLLGLGQGPSMAALATFGSVLAGPSVRPNGPARPRLRRGWRRHGSARPGLRPAPRSAGHVHALSTACPEQR